jgi:superfamily II DNA/RNA helicase
MTSFSQLGITPAFESALAADGITEPSPIQVNAIPALLAGGDAYISSETGTGKTLAYLLPALSRINPDERSLQTMVIVPTHELAIQICAVARELARAAGLELRSQALIGGVSPKRQLETLKKKPHLIVGTPGRVAELIQERKLKPHTVRHLIIDEADRLLIGDSLPTLHRIIKSTRRERQLIFVSATQDAESSGEATSLAPDLVQIQAGAAKVNAAIEHFSIECEKRDKPDVVRKLIHALQPERVIVFLHRNEDAEIVAAKLAHHKIPAVDLHGAQDKGDRKRAIEDFRKGKARVLITSDVAARGLDIRGVSHVFNFDVPTRSNDYLHRVGRTSRAGSKGSAISLMTEKEQRLAKRYRDDLGIEIRSGHLYEGVFSIDE